MTTISEDAPPGTVVETVSAHDFDSDRNAAITYRIQKGGFDDFAIDKDLGIVTVLNKLDYDRHQKYSVEIVAFDGGTENLFLSKRLDQNERPIPAYR